MTSAHEKATFLHQLTQSEINEAVHAEVLMWSCANEDRDLWYITLTNPIQPLDVFNNNQRGVSSNYISDKCLTPCSAAFFGSQAACFHPFYIHNLLFPLSAASDVNQNCHDITGAFLSFFHLFLGDFTGLTTSNSHWNHKACSYADDFVFYPVSCQMNHCSWSLDDLSMTDGQMSV